MSWCKEHKERHASGVRVSVLAEADDDLPICWICLGHSEPDRPLTHPCRCPSWCHSTCVARWQLQSAGTRREKFCDFCSCELPDWKSVLTPTPAPTAPAVMNVNFDNKTYSFQVLPGADGYRQFTEAIRKAFHLPDDSELNITFTCDEPSSGSLLTLSGPGAYDAAVHCASVSAARRSIGGTGSTTDSPPGSTTGEPRPIDAPSSAPGSPTHAANRHQQQQLMQQDISRVDRSSGSGAIQQQQQCPANLQPDAAAMHEAAASGRGHETAPAALQHASSNDHSSSSSSSSSSHSMLSRRASCSSSSSFGSVAAADDLASPASTGSSSSSGGSDAEQQQQHTVMHVMHPLSSLFHSGPHAAAAAAGGGGCPSSSVSEAGSEEHVSGSDAAAAAGELSRSSSSSRWSGASSSASGSSSSSGAASAGSSSRRSQGFGRKLREAIADMLISK